MKRTKKALKKFEKAKAKLNEAIEKKKIVEDSVTEMQHKLNENQEYLQSLEEECNKLAFSL